MLELSQPKVLAELIETAPVSITEQRDGTNGLLKIEGVGSKAGVVNANRRIYTLAVLQEAVERAQTSIADGSFTGELEHPDTTLPSGSLERTAMRMTRLWMDGPLVKFEAVVLNNAAGRDLMALLEGGVRVGMSTRGTGQVRWQEGEDGRETAFVENYTLYGIDAVKMPSNAAGLARLKESIEGLEEPHTKEASMTLKELRENHPELVEQIENEARAELQSQVNDLTSQVQERDASISDLNGSLETVKSELSEAQEVKTSIRQALVSAGVIREEEAGDADTSEVLESTRAELEAVKAEKQTLSESLKAVNDRLKAEENQKARKAKLDELLAESEFASFIAESVDVTRLASDEAVEQEVQRLTSLAERVKSTHGNPDGVPGKGVLNEGRAKTEETDEDDEIAIARRYAGLSN